MRLPGTEEWSAQAIAKRIAFERNVADGVRYVLRETARSDRITQSQRIDRFVASDAIFALGRAAELAFASDDFGLGITICSQLVGNQLARPTPPMQFAFFATVGALLGLFDVYFTSAGVGIRLAQSGVAHDPGFQQFTAWPFASAVDASRLVRLLLPAAAVSNLSGDARRVIGGGVESSLKRSVLDEVVVSPEFRLVVGLDSARGQMQSMLGLAELEARYSQRVSRLRSDEAYWRSLRPRGSIVDWPLLALMTAGIRGGMQLSDQIRTSEGKFIESLARNFAVFRPR